MEYDQLLSGLWNDVMSLPSAGEREKMDLQKENLYLRNARIRQSLADAGFDKAMKIEKARWDRHLDEVKLSFGIFEKAFSNPALSEASRDNMLHLAGMLRSSLTPTEQIALAGIASTRILSGDEQRAQEFERRFPEVKAPIANDGSPLPHDEANGATWARYYVSSAERAQKKAIAIYGVEKGKELVKLPALFQTDQKGVYAFRNPLTRALSTIDVKTDIPEGMLKRAIDEGLTSISEFARTGVIPNPDVKERSLVYNGGVYSLQSGYDVRTGKFGMKSTPVGPSQPKPLPTTMRNVMLAMGIEDKDERNKLVKDPAERGLLETYDKIKSMGTVKKIITVMKNGKQVKETVEVPSPEAESAMKALRTQLQVSWPENAWLPFITQTPKGNFWNFVLPKKFEGFHLEDSGVFWKPVAGIEQFLDANQQVFSAYRTPSGNLVDGNGNEIQDGKGKNEGETIPTVVVKPPGYAPLPLGKQEEAISRELGGVVKELIAGTGLDQAKVARTIKSYWFTKPQKSTSPIDIESFRSFLKFLQDLPKPTFKRMKDFEEWLMNLLGSKK